MVRKKLKKEWKEEESEEKIIRSGSYVELKMIYDRGKILGIKKGGNMNEIMY